MNSLYEAGFAIANAIAHRCLHRAKIAELFGGYKMAAGSPKMAMRSVFAPSLSKTSLNGE